jgi:hypothetical protein
MLVFILLLAALFCLVLGTFNLVSRINIVALALLFVVAALMYMHGIPGWRY